MITRSDPNKISNTLKEAVAESLLGNIYQSISGGNEECVVDNRPSNKFVSGFLEPTYIAKRGGMFIDETTNPVHIITIGLDFQVVKLKDAEFFVQPRFSIYIRVLPTADDLIKNKMHLELASDIERVIKDVKKQFIKKYEEENQDLLKKDKNIFYKNKREELNKITIKVLTDQFKVEFSKDLENVKKNSYISEDAILASSFISEGETIEESYKEIEEDFDEDLDQDIPFIAYPGMNSSIPDGVMNNVSPLQKWFRLDLNNLPRIDIPVMFNEVELEQLITKHNIELKSAIKQRIEQWFQDADLHTGGKFWAFPKGLKLSPNQIKNWDDTLLEIRKNFHEKNDFSLFSIPDIDICWAFEIIDQYDNPNIRTVRIALENRTEIEPHNRAEVDESVFQVAIEASIREEYQVDLKLDRIKPSYRYNEYLHYPAMGFNNGVTSLKENGIWLFRTTWMPIYAQPRIRPKQYDEIDISFAKLQTDEGTRALCALPKEFKSWINETKKTVDPCYGVTDLLQKKAELQQFSEDIYAWERECGKIEKGIELLIFSADAYKIDPLNQKSIPFRAWCFMQETMGDVSEKKGFKTWHLFQIAFIIANLPGLVSRMKEFSTTDYYNEEWDEAVSLLYFATGGGKTESFFGLLVFNLFLDRLRGKLIGVTAMLRYPLRLLTTQQAQRLSVTLAMAECIRWKYKIGGQPFAIGFWVGNSNTPNSRKSCSDVQVPFFKEGNEPLEEELLKKPEYIFAKEAWNKLPFCPFCNGETVLRKYHHRNSLIGHACIEKNCVWNNHHGGVKKEPLPFYIVDEDIYETAPCVILGTIDKLALIGQSPSTIRRIFGMLGFSPYFNEKTQMLVTPKSPVDIERICVGNNLSKLQPIYKTGESLFHDPFPSLIIQDEAHLLEESLGIFAGIFQTTFEQALKELGSHPSMKNIIAMIPGTSSPRMPKIIAASATVTEPEKQMEAIYQRNAFQFPWPGPELYRSFYAAPLQPQDDDAEQRAHLHLDEEKAYRARFYVSLMTNGKPHTSTTIEVLSYFHLLITKFLLAFSNENITVREKGREQLIAGILDSPLKSIYTMAIKHASFEDMATLIDLHRISLTYVTNKKGGDQIMSAENDNVVRLHEDQGIKEFIGLNSELISGAVSAGEIENVIKKSELRPKPGDLIQGILDNNLIRSVIATSAISHGVDVNEFNSMIFAGMPSNTSEYIQASSRVGRTHVGFSILIPTPQRRRDRYILEINDIYHRFLERLIRPASVNRWAENALIRSVTSIFQVYLIAIRELLLLIDADDHQKLYIGDYEKIDKINALIVKQGEANFNTHLINFIYNAVGLMHKDYKPYATDQLKDILRHEVIKNIVDEIIKNSDCYVTLRSFFDSVNNSDKEKKRSPMTSLRDVDISGKISFEKKGDNSVDSSTAYNIMRIISRRNIKEK